MDKYKRRSIFNAVMAIFAIALIITVAILSKDVAFSEKATRKITFAFTNFFGRISSAFPFSIFEILVFVAVVFTIYLLVKGIVMLAKRNFSRGICSFTTLISAVLCIVSVYMLDTSFAYNREEPPLEGIYQNGELSEKQQLRAIDNFMVDFINVAYSIKRDETGMPVCDYSIVELSELIAKEYEKLEDEYYDCYVPRAKGMISSALMSELHLIGITFTPIGEANVNKQAPVYDRIFTTAHEMAHSIGIMREEDANLVATYVLINSNNRLLRYAAMTTYSDRMLSIVEILDPEKHKEYVKAIEKSPVAKEYRKASSFWSSNGSLSKISDFFNNIYLKFNGQNLGTGSYNDGNFWEVTPSDPDEDGNVTYEIELSDIQLVLLTRYRFAD